MSNLHFAKLSAKNSTFYITPASAAMNQTIIEFYDPKQMPYGVFSNYFVRSIVVIPENPPEYASKIVLLQLANLLLPELAKLAAQYAYDIEQITFQSVEHFYQSMKFSNSPEYQKVIRNAKTPYIAYLLGRQQKSYRFAWQREINDIITQFQAKGITIATSMDPDWDRVKLQVMLAGLRAKFHQHRDLASFLQSTQDATIKEVSNRDNYWATGKDGLGLNHLGKLLMQVRSELSTIPLQQPSGNDYTSDTKHKRKRAALAGLI